MPLAFNLVLGLFSLLLQRSNHEVDIACVMRIMRGAWLQLALLDGS